MRQALSVAASGSCKNELIASPIVIIVFSFEYQKMKTIKQTLTKLQTITIASIDWLICTLQSSGNFWLKQLS